MRALGLVAREAEDGSFASALAQAVDYAGGPGQGVSADHVRELLNTVPVSMAPQWAADRFKLDVLVLEMDEAGKPVGEGKRVRGHSSRGLFPGLLVWREEGDGSVRWWGARPSTTAMLSARGLGDVSRQEAERAVRGVRRSARETAALVWARRQTLLDHVPDRELLEALMTTAPRAFAPYIEAPVPGAVEVAPRQVLDAVRTRQNAMPPSHSGGPARPWGGALRGPFIGAMKADESAMRNGLLEAARDAEARNDHATADRLRRTASGDWESSRADIGPAPEPDLERPPARVAPGELLPGEHAPATGPDSAAESASRVPTLAIDPAVTPLAITPTGLPQTGVLVEQLRAIADRNGVRVSEENWESLPDQLLTNLPFLHGGFLVPLGDAEILVTLEVSDPVEVPLAGQNPFAPARLPAIAEETAEEAAEEGDTTADPTRSRDIRRRAGGVDAGLSTGADVAAHTGGTKAMRLSAVVGFLFESIFRIGPGLSFSEQHRRDTRVTWDAERARVQDDRGPGRLLAYRSQLSAQLRTREGLIAETARTPADPGRELYVWLPEHYMTPVPRSVRAADRVAGAHGLPEVFHAVGLTALPELFGRTVQALEAHGVRLPVGGAARRSLMTQLWKLHTFLDDAVGTHGYRFVVHGNRGPKASITVRTEFKKVRMVGSPADEALLEGVSTGILGTGGGHQVGYDSTFKPAVFDVAPFLFDVMLMGDGNFAFGVSGEMSFSRGFAHSASRTGLDVRVRRSAGPTFGYDVVMEHRVEIGVRGETLDAPVRVTGTGQLRLPADEALERGFPVALSALTEEARDSVTEAPDGTGLLPLRAGTLDLPGRDGVPRPLPEWVRAGPGFGAGLLQTESETSRVLLTRIHEALAGHGFLPENLDEPLSDRRGGKEAAAMRVHNLERVIKYTSRQSLQSMADDMQQGGLTFTLHMPHGALGVRWDIDAARITLRAEKQTGGRFDGSDRDVQVVNLIMGMDVASGAVERALKLQVGAKVRLGFGKVFKAVSAGFEIGRKQGVTSQVTQLTNMPRLLEHLGADSFEFDVRYTATIEMQHGDVRGMLRPGGRDPLPIALPDQKTVLKLIPFTGGHKKQDNGSPPPVGVLEHAYISYLDTSSIQGLGEEFFDTDLVDPQGHAGEEIRSFLSHSLIKTHFTEAAHHQLTSDQFFGPGFLRDTNATIDLRVDLEPLMWFRGVTEDPAVLGDIRLRLGQTSLSAARSSFLKWGQFDLMFGGSTQSGDGDGFLQGGVDGSRTWQRTRKRTAQNTGGLEELGIFTSEILYQVEMRYSGSVALGQHKSGKFVRPSGKGAVRSVGDQRVVVLLLEEIALHHYARGDIPVGLGQIEDAMDRWNRGDLRLSGNIVAGALVRWSEEAAEEARSDDGQALDWTLPSAIRRHAGRLADLDAEGTLPVLEPRARERFYDAFADVLAARGTSPAEPSPLAVSLPDYLTGTGATENQRTLGHAGVHRFDLKDASGAGTSVFDLVRDLVDRAAPGLLTGKPEVWTADPRPFLGVNMPDNHVGRLQGGLNALQALYAKNREKSLVEESLGAEGHIFYLFNPGASGSGNSAWSLPLRDVLKINVRLGIESPFTAQDFWPGAGLENYAHDYSNAAQEQSLAVSQSFSVLKFGGGDGDTGAGMGGLAFSESHGRGNTATRQSTNESTLYAHEGSYFVAADVRATVTVEHLDTTTSPLNRLAVGLSRSMHPERRSALTAEASGRMELQVPRGLAEFRPFQGPLAARVPVSLPYLHLNTRILPVIMDDALPAAQDVLRRVFGPQAEGRGLRAAVDTVVDFLRGRTAVSGNRLVNHTLPQQTNRHMMTQYVRRAVLDGSAELTRVTLAGTSRTARLWLHGKLFDLQVIGPVTGAGTGRYSKSQDGVAVRRSSDHWRASGSIAPSGSVGDHQPVLDSSTLQGSPARQTSAGVADTLNSNYRREQHIKERDELHLVLLRAVYHLEAKEHTARLVGRHAEGPLMRSGEFDGAVLVEMPAEQVRELSEAMAAGSRVRSRNTQAWQRLAGTPSVDIGGLLVDEADAADYNLRRLHGRLAGRIRGAAADERRELALHIDRGALEQRVLDEVREWARDHGVTESDGWDGTSVPARVHRLIREVDASAGPDTVRQHPDIARVLSLSDDALAQGLALEFRTHVRLDTVRGAAVERRRWADPQGFIHAFDPAPGADGSPSASDRVRDWLSSDEAERAGLLTREQRGRIALWAIGPSELGRIYATTLERGDADFTTLLLAELDRRQNRLREVHPRLPEAMSGLWERTEASAGTRPGDEAGAVPFDALLTLDRLRHIAA
ncbi:hypothetical protein, partial [Streptomyces zhihengii]|uniref:hypothetical protein n=1 Tax=Streptomyces zhihengii TaxID=1818004 RepID=UPI00339EFD1D